MSEERDKRFDRFYSDPEAIEWAASAVQRLVDQTRRVAEGASTPERRKEWERRAQWIEWKLIGGEGCVIAPFDPRRAEMWPEVVKALDESPPAPPVTEP